MAIARASNISPLIIGLTSVAIGTSAPELVTTLEASLSGAKDMALGNIIGSNIVKGLNDSGEDNIIVVDNLSNAEKHLNINSLSILDYLDKNDFLAKLNNFKDIKTIFHKGACSSTTETDGKYMMSNNFEYSKTLLNFSLENKINFLY